MNTKNVKTNTTEHLTGAQILATLLKSEGLTANDFARKIGVGSQTVYNILDGRVAKISTRLTEKICAKFTYVNPRWLRTGEGEMVNNTPKVSQIANNSHDFSQNAHTYTRTCENCKIVENLQMQINKLLDIVANLQK